MNQKERDKFPRIYELMDDLAKRDCDKKDGDELNELLESLEPRERDTGKLVYEPPKWSQELLTKAFYSLLGSQIDYKDYLHENDYTPRKGQGVVNYTKPLEKRLKRAFIIVLGALGSVWFYVDDKGKQEVWNTWFEYKKTNKDFGLE